jgi:hypothetical protein
MSIASQTRQRPSFVTARHQFAEPSQSNIGRDLNSLREVSLRSRLCIMLATVLFAFLFSTNVPTVRAQQKPLTTEQTQIKNTVATIFTAAGTDDVAKFDSVIATDFYIFDGGARFDGDAIMALIKAQHAAGKRYEWNVTEPDVHISGNTGLDRLRQ